MGYNKFHAQRTTAHGRTFDSRGEAQCFEFLAKLQELGEISGLRHQKYVNLVAGIRYKADYYFVDLKLNEEVWGEYKGFETPEWRLKLKLWKVFGPGRLRIWRGHFPRYSVEDIVPDAAKIQELCPQCRQRKHCTDGRVAP